MNERDLEKGEQIFISHSYIFFYNTVLQFQSNFITHLMNEWLILHL